MKLFSIFTSLAAFTMAAAQVSLNAHISCQQGPRDATLQNPTSRNYMLNCINSLEKGLPPFQVGDFTGIRCGRNWHMFKKDAGGSAYFNTNADCLKGCGACLRLQANEGHRTGYCSYYPDTKRWPSAMCVVGWAPLSNMVCSVPPTV